MHKKYALLLLALFFVPACESGTPTDPTDPDGQFCDQGPSYATAVFATPAQKPAAEASRRAAAARIRTARFVTPVRDVARFWPAEAHHQDFARRNPARYGGYTRFCGRAARLRAVWGV